MFRQLLLFIVGLAVGSFLNLVIDRTPKDESILHPGSYCDRCRRSLSPGDLVPLISFVYLKGRCRYCRSPLSVRMPAVELLTGAVFSLIGLTTQENLPLPLALFAASLLIGVGVSDLVNGLIPDILVFPGILVIGFWNLITGSWWRLLVSLCFSLFFWVIFRLTQKKGLGFGDVKLAALLGLILDPFLGILSLDFSLILGGGIGLILVMTRKKKFGETMPLGSFLAFGYLIFLVFGEVLQRWLPIWTM